MELFIGLFIAFLIGCWVTKDAQRRGKSDGEALAWGASVFLLLIVFLPIYLIARPPLVNEAAQQNELAAASVARVDELEKLAFLKERGFVTEDEFAAKKRRLLGV